LPLRPPPLTTTITVAASGSAPRHEVWSRYTTPARWHEWSPQISRVDVEEPDSPVVPGRTGTVHGPLGVGVAFRIIDVDTAAGRWTWAVSVGLIRLHLQHGVDAERGRSRAWVAITGALPIVLGYAPAARVALGRLVADARE
jgi:hypothetical protein